MSNWQWIIHNGLWLHLLDKYNEKRGFNFFVIVMLKYKLQNNSPSNIRNVKIICIETFLI
jgi:hypothetical protein